MDAMRQVIALLLMMLPLCVKAQGGDVIRGNCTPGLSDDGTDQSRGQRRILSVINTDWDPQKVYHQPVVLISFADMDFSLEHPRETYDSIFNEPGFNKGDGPGCVADYYREQSGGLMNLQFDVFGPYKVLRNAKLNPNANANTMEYGSSALTEATNMWISEDPERSYGKYDWNGDLEIDQIIYVYAGYSGNENNSMCFGYIWPNTSSFSRIKTPDGYWAHNYTCSGEIHSNGKSWGIGTICHEFAHSLGLPDIYPTVSNAGYSMVDEWDLMDGGNFTRSGWCPPNFSGLERMLMGWQTPIELTEPSTIRDMKSVSEGGPVYMVRHTDSEYYLLENRQWTGWDRYLPGKGLAVFHVCYDRTKWRNNKVNNSVSQRGYQLVCADNLNYDAWDLIIGEGKSPYLNRHNLHLSSAAYPWATDSTDFVNNCLDDNSTPASLMYYTNAAGSKFLSKSITNIQVADDGTVSFDFMGGDPTDADEFPILTAFVTEPIAIYDLSGRRVTSQRPGQIYIIRYSDGSTRKVVRR